MNPLREDVHLASEEAVELDRAFVQHHHRLKEHPRLGRKQRNDFHCAEALVVESERLASLDRMTVSCEVSCASPLEQLLHSTLNLLPMGHHFREEVTSVAATLAHSVMA